MLTPLSSERTTIGFLLASLHTGASLMIWPGLLDAAEQHDVNLICFPGGRLQATDSFEKQRNAIFGIACNKCLDGLITWSSTLGGVLGTKEVKAFHDRYYPLPMVSLAQFMEGTPTVSVDSYTGMRALLLHLVEKHGYRKLAFIRGPEEHYYAQERYRAYLDVLKSTGLPLNPQLVTRPLPWEAGSEAIEMLLDERGLVPGKDFDAVVAVSDMMAIWAMKKLQLRGYIVPTDVAVTGFNNSMEERMATPPLTTVELPFNEQGVKAMEVLLQLLNNEAVPALITLPARLVVRESCGCPSKAVALASVKPAGKGKTAKRALDLSEVRSGCLAELETVMELDATHDSKWLESLIEMFMLEVQKPSKHFVNSLYNLLDQHPPEGTEAVSWQNLLSIIRRWLLRYHPESKQVAIETLVSTARVVVGEAEQHAHAFMQWQADRTTEKLNELNRALLTTVDMDQLTDVLAENLPAVGIPSVYLVTYETPTDSVVPSTGRLILACSDNKRIELGKKGLQFQTQQIVPPQFLPQGHRYSLVIEPLFFQDKSLGYVVLEIGPRNGHTYELLRNNLSSAMQSALLFQEIQQARLSAEKADRIKTRLLANVSHEMRTPLNIIMGYTQGALQSRGKYGNDLPSALTADLEQIQSNAEHQLRVINDLLDLSRAEIDELDLSLEVLDPYQIIQDAFRSFADQSTSGGVRWKLEMPERLPKLRADPVRFRQILLNLLSNAQKYTRQGEITLGVEVNPPDVHFWISDTGMGIDSEHKEQIFEPFVTIDDNRQIAGGIGLGLSIPRHLVALHGGSMTLDSIPGKGSTFHIYLPLPALDYATPKKQLDLSPVLLLISPCDQPAPEIVDMCKRQKLEIFPYQSTDDLESVLNQTNPVAIAWDLSNAQPGDWTLVRRIRNYPHLSQVPFILYGQLAETQVGMTGFLTKSANTTSLHEAILAMKPSQGTGPVLIVDDDPRERQLHKKVVESGLPGYPILMAENGEMALELMAREAPSLVLLDLMMPNLSGADVLDRMRADANLRLVPVIVLSKKVLTLEDVKRIEKHTRVTLQSKGIWSEEETATALNRAIIGVDTLPAHTSAFVKQAIAHMQQNYARPISRWEIAEAVGVSEDYLSRVFNQELKLSPWDYLNRYRVLQSKYLLLNTTQSIGAIASQVGFKDQAYFSRVFHKITGMSPQAFRESGPD
ncbi:MAG: substrate-binding domain-containing protein [Anaerolineaceae bacterium]|nr:substrate-binding domain-containing protein [Anaerolineaceae bacterium]